MLILDKLHWLMRRLVVSMGGRLVAHDVDGYTVESYEIPGKGNGPPIVLLHGLGGTGNSFFSILSRLRDDWSRIYVPEMPGHGSSLLRPGQQPLGVLDHQRIFSKYLDVAVRGPAVLVGNSLGGGIVLQTATERSDVLALALLAPAGAPFSEQDLQAIRGRFDGSSNATALAFLNALTHRPTFVNRIVARDMREVIGSSAVQTVLAEVGLGRHIDEERVRSLTMPILLVWGTSERILPKDGLAFFRQILPPHARIEVMPDCGHLPMMEHPSRTIRLLQELRRSIPDAGRLRTSA